MPAPRDLDETFEVTDGHLVRRVVPRDAAGRTNTGAR